MGKISNLIGKEFGSEPVYGDNDKYIKAKVKIYEDNIETIFHDEKRLKESISYKCLPKIMLDSIITANKKYYPQTLLEECKYEVKKK